MEVSWNRGTPRSSIWIGLSIINHPAIGILQAEALLAQQVARSMEPVASKEAPCSMGLSMGYTSKVHIIPARDPKQCGGVGG